MGGNQHTAAPMEVAPTYPADTAHPFISVLVAAWNEAEHLSQHIESFLGLTYPSKELILCAGGTDGTYDIAQRYAGSQVKVIEQKPGQGKQRALAQCLEHSSGTVIYLTDADCILNTDALLQTINPIICGDAAAASGSSRPLKHQQQPFVLYQWAVDRYSVNQFGKNSPGFMGRNAAMRADVLRAVGGFDIPAPTGTDYTLGRQFIVAGYPIHNVPSSEVETNYPADVHSYYLKRSRWLRNLIVIGWRTNDRAQLTNALKSVLVGWAFIGMPVLAVVLGPIILVIWALLWVYACAARIRYVLQSGLSFPSHLHLQIAIAAFSSFWIDIVVWSSMLFQILSPRWRRKWG